MLDTMNMAMNAIQTAFPGVPILPVIGNNDVEYHDQAPSSADAFSYYTDMWTIYVENVAANALVWTASMQASFMTGGYYSYSLGTGVTVIGLNGMYPFDQNTNDVGMSATMISWVEQQFLNNPNERFIIQYHVWPGCNYFEGQECFWVQPYLD